MQGLSLVWRGLAPPVANLSSRMALRLCKASYLAQRILRPRDALPVRGGAFNPVPLGKPVSEPVRT